jgi:acetyl esterase/lipase
VSTKASEKVIGPRIPDLRTVLLDLSLRLRVKRNVGHLVSDAGLRKSAAAFRESAKNTHTPPFVGVTRVDIAGRTAEWVTATDETDKAILYFHGGGFFFSSPKDHRPLIWRLARATSRRVLAIDYRKAPDHVFPAWLDDAFATYQHALAEGIAPEDIVLSGDSAGGNIALALTHRLRREGVPLPDSLVLFSPWADLTCSGKTYGTKSRRDAMFKGPATRELGRYLTRGRDPRDPEISPVHADFTGFPRMLVFAGSTEIFLDDARAVVRKAAAAGVDARLVVYRHMPHIFPMFAGVAPRAKEAFPIVKAFVDEGRRTSPREADVSPKRSAVASPVRA